LANSLGTVISDLVNRAEPLLKSLAEITPEQIESTKKAGLELADKLKESSVLGEDALKQQVEVKAQQ
jgi:predicted lysophospholipase L1 biosynthesis ABC-type transport system permease subunit